MMYDVCMYVCNVCMNECMYVCMYYLLASSIYVMYVMYVMYTHDIFIYIIIKYNIPDLQYAYMHMHIMHNLKVYL